MKSIFLGLMLTGAAAISGGIAQGASIPVFSTGVVSPGVPQADGLADLNYTLTSAPVGVPTGNVFVTDQTGFPFPFWAADDSSSKWISPQPSYNNSQTDPPGTYIYQTTFSLVFIRLLLVWRDFFHRALRWYSNSEPTMRLLTSF